MIYSRENPYYKAASIIYNTRKSCELKKKVLLGLKVAESDHDLDLVDSVIVLPNKLSFTLLY